MADISPTKNGRLIGLVIIQINLKVKHLKMDCIIHYIYIFPKFQHKGVRIYFIGKVFQSDAQLDGRVYAVTTLIHDYTSFGYVESKIKYSDLDVYNQIVKYNEYVKGGKLRRLTFCKYILKKKDYSMSKRLIHYFLCIVYFRYTRSIL